MPALACPRCERQLEKEAEGRLSCADCRLTFPLLGEPSWAVPLIWPEPGGALLDWRNRFNAALADIEQQLNATRTADPGLPEMSKQRLELLHEAYARYLQEVNTLLSPLRPGQALARETHMALKTRLPTHHGILSYAQNIHRDWCWGTAENQQVCTHLLDALSQGAHTDAMRPASMLVLGAGSGRLAYDLHTALCATETWSLDSNPLLCIVGSRVARGDTLNLTEFPLAPITLEDAAVLRTLTAPAAVRGLQFVCADALHPPFAARQFDLVITPWLLDVIDAGISDVLRVIIRLLKPGGRWLQHGSVAFDGARPANRMTAEELCEVSRNAGFEIIHTQDSLLPYLQSPASRQRRYELTFTQVSGITENQAPAEARPEFQHLPDWIVSGRTPVPLTPAFKTQITTVRIHAFIISLIDGKRSVQDMARVLEEQRLMPAQEAVQAIRGFLTTMYEEGARMVGSADN